MMSSLGAVVIVVGSGFELDKVGARVDLVEDLL